MPDTVASDVASSPSRFGFPVIDPNSPVVQAFAAGMAKAGQNKPQGDVQPKPSAKPDPAATPPPESPTSDAKPDVARPKKTLADIMLPRKPEVKPEVKPETEDQQEERDMPPEIKSVEGRKNWKIWKTKHNALVQEHALLAEQKAARDREFADLQAKLAAANPDDIDKLRHERDALRHTLRLKDITSLPEWHDRFDKPITAAIERAKRAVPAEAQARMEALLRIPASEVRDEAIQEIVADLPPLKQSLVSTALVTIDETSALRADALKDEQALIAGFEKWQQQERAKADAAAKEHAVKSADKAFASALQEAAKTLPLYQMLTDGKEDEKAIASAAVEAARGLVQTANTPEAIAALALAAVNGEKAGEVVVEAIREIERLQGEITRLEGSTPKTTTGAASTPSGPSNFIEAFRSALK